MAAALHTGKIGAGARGQRYNRGLCARAGKFCAHELFELIFGAIEPPL